MIAHRSELHPVWKCVREHPPPLLTRCLFLTFTGIATIGSWHPEYGFTHWCGLPKHEKNDMTTESFRDLQKLVLDWATARQIIPNSTPRAQATKTQEELDELTAALESGTFSETVDAYGDILVTLIVGMELAGIDPIDALEHAWLQIKDRKGTLNADGIFVKEVA